MDSRVIFVVESLKKAFSDLKDRDKRLYKEIEKALGDIKQNAFCGRSVRKKLIPKRFVEKYDITNLWIYNLRKDWRLLYSLADDEIEVIALVLDWMNHKDYEKLFKF